MDIPKGKQKISTVAILAIDAYSRNWISHIILLDWRTRIIEEFTSFEEIKGKFSLQKIDFFLIDVDDYKDNLSEILNYLRIKFPRTKIILLASNVINSILENLEDEIIYGFLLKSEAAISLGWVIEYVMEGKLVITETIMKEISSLNIEFGEKCLVITGVEAEDYLTSNENRYARMAFVHSMPRGNLADEIMITPNSSWTIISSLYNNLGVSDMLHGKDWIKFNLEDHDIILTHLNKIEGGEFTTRKGTSKETLAFHVYSKPRIIH